MHTEKLFAVRGGVAVGEKIQAVSVSVKHLKVAHFINAEMPDSAGFLVNADHIIVGIAPVKRERADAVKLTVTAESLFLFCGIFIIVERYH